MDHDKINKWLTLGANVGVIAGIVFLGIELSQNNEHAASQAKYNMLQNQVSVIAQISSSSELGEVIARARASAELLPADEVRLNALAAQTVYFWKWEFEEFEAGRIEGLPVEAWRGLFAGSPVPLPISRVWQPIAAQNPAFAKFMTENIVN
ncbi:MAG: hypothetical protein V4628_16190 [Pseudomonadota bacterium]